MTRKAIKVLFTCGFVTFAVFTIAAAQNVGNCRHGKAWADLDVNRVHARMYNTGTLFWRGSGGLYRVPKHSGVNAIFLATLQMGGLVGGEYRIVGSNYGPFEFWPGPLDETGRPPEDCAEYDRIYSISRDSLEYFERTGEATRGIAEWPAHLGAPVLDGDGVAQNYNLQEGDRPALIGDQMLWWVMNDAGNSKGWMSTPPLPLEIQMTAFAFDGNERFQDHPMANALIPVLQNATFYRYRLRYMGNEPLESAWFSIWTDFDFGAQDNYIGSDPSLGLGLVYNGDDFDEDYGRLKGYGTPPPALGYDFFRGPVLLPDSLDNDNDGVTDEAGERGGATRFLMHSHNSTPDGWPSTPKQAHDLLRGIWRDGTPLTYGGGGYRSGSRAHFMYSGNPPVFWSEENVDGRGGRNTSGYRHFNISTGPFRMEPGDTEDIYLGILWSQGRDRLDSVYKLKFDDALVQSVFDELIQPYRAEEPPPPTNYALVHHYPSPVLDRGTVTFQLPQQEHVRLIIYDVLGREVRRLVDEIRPAGSHRVDFEVGDLSSGVYLYELQAGFVRGARTMIVAR